MPPKQFSEDSLQQSCCFWFGMQYHKYCRLIHHSANEGKRSYWNGSRLKAMGMQKGFPDLFIAVPRGQYHGLFVELKTATGRLTPEQKEMISLLAEQGYKTAVVRSMTEFIALVTDYMDK